MPSANHPVQLTVAPAHVMPAGLDVTVPELVPPIVTVSGSVRAGSGAIAGPETSALLSEWNVRPSSHESEDRGPTRVSSFVVSCSLSVVS